jgi:hypothetical protein
VHSCSHSLVRRSRPGRQAHPPCCSWRAGLASERCCRPQPCGLPCARLTWMARLAACKCCRPQICYAFGRKCPAKRPYLAACSSGKLGTAQTGQMEGCIPSNTGLQPGQSTYSPSGAACSESPSARCFRLCLLYTNYTHSTCACICQSFVLWAECAAILHMPQDCVPLFHTSCLACQYTMEVFTYSSGNKCTNYSRNKQRSKLLCHVKFLRCAIQAALNRPPHAHAYFMPLITSACMHLMRWQPWRRRVRVPTGIPSPPESA